MASLEHNGLRIFGDEDGRIVTQRSLDGGFHFFHVCCGCHKVHEAHFHVKNDGETLVSSWELPLPNESAKIIEGLPPSLEKDLIVFERANFNAAEEIAQLKARLATVEKAHAEAVEALRPFAHEAAYWKDTAKDGWMWGYGARITIGDIRRAARIVEGATAKCGTCGGSQTIRLEHDCWPGAIDERPCPDCAKETR